MSEFDPMRFAQRVLHDVGLGPDGPATGDDAPQAAGAMPLPQPPPELPPARTPPVLRLVPPPGAAVEIAAGELAGARVAVAAGIALRIGAALWRATPIGLLTMLPGDTPRDDLAARPDAKPKTLPVGPADINGQREPMRGFIDTTQVPEGFLRMTPVRSSERHASHEAPVAQAARPSAAADAASKPPADGRTPRSDRQRGRDWLEDEIRAERLRPDTDIAYRHVMRGARIGENAAKRVIIEATHDGLLEFRGKFGSRVVRGAKGQLLAAGTPKPLPPVFRRRVDVSGTRQQQVDAVVHELERVLGSDGYERGDLLPTPLQLKHGLGLTRVAIAVKAYSQLADRDVVTWQVNGGIRYGKWAAPGDTAAKQRVERARRAGRVDPDGGALVDRGLAFVHDEVGSGRWAAGHRTSAAAVAGGARITHDAAKAAVGKAVHAGLLQRRGRLGVEVVPGARQQLQAGSRVKPLPAGWHTIDLNQPHRGQVAAVSAEVRRVLETGLYAKGATLPLRRDLAIGLGLPSVALVVGAYEGLAREDVLALHIDGRVTVKAWPASTGTATARPQRTFERAMPHPSDDVDRAVLDAIRRGIRLHHPPGRPLPGSKEIALQVGEPETAVLRALQVLVGERVIGRLPGRGTWVLDRNERRQPIDPPSEAQHKREALRTAREHFLEGHASGLYATDRPFRLEAAMQRTGVGRRELLQALTALRGRVELRYYEAPRAVPPDRLDRLRAPLVRTPGDSQAQAIVQRVSGVLTTGKGLRAGQVLHPVALGEAWKVDPKSVRQAFAWLASEGLLVHDGHGHRVPASQDRPQRSATPLRQVAPIEGPTRARESIDALAQRAYAHYVAKRPGAKEGFGIGAMAVELGVSKSRLAVALARLAEQGLLVRYPGLDTFLPESRAVLSRGRPKVEADVVNPKTGQRLFIEIVRYVEGQIARGRLRPRDIVSRDELAERFGRSPGPVDRALSRLVGKGVLIRQGDTFRVALPNATRGRR